MRHRPPGGFFYPLDTLLHWNRVYGRARLHAVPVRAARRRRARARAPASSSLLDPPAAARRSCASSRTAAPRAKGCCRSPGAASRSPSTSRSATTPRPGRPAQRARHRRGRAHLPGQGRLHPRPSTSGRWSRGSSAFLAVRRTLGSGPAHAQRAVGPAVRRPHRERRHASGRRKGMGRALARVLARAWRPPVPARPRSRRPRALRRAICRGALGRRARGRHRDLRPGASPRRSTPPWPPPASARQARRRRS